MKAEDVVQRANLLTVKLRVDSESNKKSSAVSPEYVIRGSVVFQAKITSGQKQIILSTHGPYMILIRFSKLRPEEDLTYTAKFSSTELAIVSKEFISDDGTWHMVYNNTTSFKRIYCFDVTILTDVLPSRSPFASLHEDTELTNFQLRGEDGSVHMHRTVLAASSPVLRRMLGGTWRETAEGHVDIPGTSQLTLQNLKDYLYLRTLPEHGVKQLLLLSSCYMMHDLEQRCIDKLIRELTEENVCEEIEFSVKHKLTGLMLAILDCIQCGTVKVANMSKHFW